MEGDMELCEAIKILKKIIATTATYDRDIVFANQVKSGVAYIALTQILAEINKKEAPSMTAKEAGEICKVRGYIAQKSVPEIKVWKNTHGFYQCLPNLPGDDWETNDPEGEAASIVG